MRRSELKAFFTIGDKSALAPHSYDIDREIFVASRSIPATALHTSPRGRITLRTLR